ncbi:hypothetical protein IEQ44_12335 [Nocardioides sp. Y6]|uniref:DUF732 domain-containing protein n=1 Tax=Nocardioides malaquae TaxID=2773426 RepID=A0ABR9RV84_9ACTN|nr:hypothetical protein [Nocardioides malaquae]MBE7325441.1 hypothetical protein [Nocardioides malaquae]
MKLRIRSLALAPVVALALTACGASEEEYAEAMTDGLSSAESQPISQAKAGCVSDAFVGRLGTERLGEMGDPADLEAAARSLSFPGLNLTEAEGNDLYDDFISCDTDLNGLVTAELADQGLALPDELMECLSKKLSAEQMRGYFVPLMRSGQTDIKRPVMKKIERGVVTCAEEFGPQG